MSHFEEFKKMLQTSIATGADIKPETELQSLGIDSLDLVQIIVDAEEKYGITFSNEELSGFVTVSDVVKAIDEKL